MNVPFRRRRRPSLRTRVDEALLSVFAAVWITRVVWGLRKGRLHSGFKRRPRSRRR